MTLGSAIATRTRVPMLFLSTFECHSDNKQAQFYARKLSSDIGRWSSALSYQTSQSVLPANTLRDPEIGAQFHPDYLLTGDLQFLDEGIRASVVMSEAREGLHMWAQTYQLDGDETSTLIDKLAGNIAAAIAFSIAKITRERFKNVPEDQLDAWGLVGRSMGLSMRTNQEAREWLRISRLAVQRDENFAEAHANLADGIRAILLASFDCDISDEDLKREALHHCDRALILDEDKIFNLNRGSRVHLVLGNRMQALQLAKRVNELTQGRSVAALYQALIANGKSQQVIDHARDHIENIANLTKDALIFTKGTSILATAQIIVGKYSEAEAELRGCVSRSPSAYLLWMRLANVLALQGKSDEAREALAEAIRIGPSDWGLGAFLRRLRIKWGDNPDMLRPLTSGLRSLEEGQAPLDRLGDQDHDGALAPANQLAKLSSRQKSVLKIALTGKLNKVIANELNIAEGTVKAHLSAAFKVLGVKNRTEAVYLLSQRQVALDFKRP